MNAPAFLHHLSNAHELLDRYQTGDAFFMAGPQHTLHAACWHRPVLAANSPSGLAYQAQQALAQARRQGLAQPVVMGAIPFDAQQPACLGVAEPAWRDGPVLRPQAPASSVSTGASAVRAWPASQGYAQAVAQAVRRIRAGELDKVVLARTLEVTLTEPLPMPEVLARLAQRNPRGYSFAVNLGQGRQLLGASPELLVSRRHGRLRAHPLAGSIPRSADPQEDQRRAQALLRSPKDLAEHRVVVQAVAQALRPLCPDLHVPKQPSLVATPTMWHLGTEVSGPTQADALSLALALHPTPAVCGAPRSLARALIGELEPFEREFYAGTLGWVDAAGDGEWIVTLRCAQLEGQRLRLYAGAGIVADSDPQAEVQETGAKLRTMLEALGLAEPLTPTQEVPA